VGGLRMTRRERQNQMKRRIGGTVGFLVEYCEMTKVTKKGNMLFKARIRIRLDDEGVENRIVATLFANSEEELEDYIELFDPEEWTI
jgi:hypothetical protein